MNDNRYSSDALVLKAFCDENRLRIMEQLRYGEVCAHFLLKRLTISQSTLSHHMKILVDSGLVNARRDGKWTRYSLSKDGIIKAKSIVDEFTTIENVDRQKCGCKHKYHNLEHDF